MRELQAEVREGMVSKKAELDNLPPECSRIDLISYACALPTQYTILFPTQKIKDSWENQFLRAKEVADFQAPPSATVAPPTSPLPVRTGACQELEFVKSIIVRSVRTGMQVCTAYMLPIPSLAVIFSSPFLCSLAHMCYRGPGCGLHPL